MTDVLIFFGVSIMVGIALILAISFLIVAKLFKCKVDQQIKATNNLNKK